MKTTREEAAIPSSYNLGKLMVKSDLPNIESWMNGGFLNFFIFSLVSK